MSNTTNGFKLKIHLHAEQNSSGIVELRKKKVICIEDYGLLQSDAMSYEGFLMFSSLKSHTQWHSIYPQ